MSVSAVVSGASQSIQAPSQTQSRPVAQVTVPKEDQVQISAAAKELHAKAAHVDHDHDGN